MKQLLFPKRYKELLREKEDAEKKLRRFLAKKVLTVENQEALGDVADLGLRGGPKDLSAKMDHYLYS